MGHEKLSIRLQQKLGLPHQHVSLMPLFKCLSVANIIAVFQHVLAEGKLVLVSSSYTLLTPVAEAIRALLYPFKWQCVSGDHMVMTRSGWRYLFDIHREFEAANLQIAARVEGAALPVIEVSSFNRHHLRHGVEAGDGHSALPCRSTQVRASSACRERGWTLSPRRTTACWWASLAKQHLVAGSFGYQTVSQPGERGLPEGPQVDSTRRSSTTATVWSCAAV